MPMAIKPNNAYPNLTTDYLADYTLGFTFAPLLMKIPLNTDLTIRLDPLFWGRSLALRPSFASFFAQFFSANLESF